MESKIKDYLEEELAGLINKEKGMEIENKAAEIEIRVPNSRIFIVLTIFMMRKNIRK